MREDIESFLSSRALALRTADNLLVSELEHQAGATVVESLPHYFNIVTTTQCNLKCVMCDHGNGTIPNRAHLQPETVDRLSSFITQVRTMEVYGIGEPMLSPSFWRLLDRLAPLNVLELSINSNGTLLNEDRIERILRSPLTRISVSVDAARPETYRKIRGPDLSRVLENVSRLVRKRNELSPRKLAVLMNMTLMRENIEELPEFVDLAADLGVDGIFFWHLHDTARNSRWHTTKEDWVFDYDRQHLKHAPALANTMIEAAVRRAAVRRIDIQWDHGKSLRLRE